MLAALDLIELLQAALPLIFGLGWLVLQVVSALQGNDNKQKQAAQKRRAQAVGQGEAADQADAKAEEQANLRSEVDEFLRRLKDPDAKPEPPAPPRPAQDRAPRPVRPRRPRVEVLVDDAPAPAPSEDPRRLVPAADVTQPPEQQRKRRAAKPAPFDQAERLREQAAGAEARIHEKFDQEVGNLTVQSSEAADHAYDEPAYDTPADRSETPQPAAAQQIADMLRDPDNVRNAVILNEILTRRS